MNLQSFLNGLNDLIGYTGDKEEFNNKFIGIIYDKAIDESLKNLPEDKKTEIAGELRGITDANILQEAINKHFSSQDFNKSLKCNAQKVMEDYLITIDSELSDEQRKKISEYFASFKPQT